MNAAALNCRINVYIIHIVLHIIHYDTTKRDWLLDYYSLWGE